MGRLLTIPSRTRYAPYKSGHRHQFAAGYAVAKNTDGHSRLLFCAAFLQKHIRYDIIYKIHWSSVVQTGYKVEIMDKGKKSNKPLLINNILLIVRLLLIILICEVYKQNTYIIERGYPATENTYFSISVGWLPIILSSVCLAANLVRLFLAFRRKNTSFRFFIHCPCLRLQRISRLPRLNPYLLRFARYLRRLLCSAECII